MVRIHGTREVVKAVLMNDGPKDIPKEVSFLYTGDPTKEVHLMEETDAILPSIILLLIPFVPGYWYFKRMWPPRKGNDRGSG